jgi:hypothetical protein
MANVFSLRGLAASGLALLVAFGAQNAHHGYVLPPS